MESRKVSWSALATVAGAVVATLALAWSVWTYQDTANRQAEMQAESAAVGALREHFNLAAEHPDVKWDSENLEYRRFASHALFTADTTDDLVDNVPKEQQEAWRNTLMGIVADHSEYIASRRFPCDEYDGAFIDDYILENDKFTENEKTANQNALNSNPDCL